ncbi:MAG: peptidoglycan D,D-transpeptidase FtsI family protein [Candidatus Puniceispirillaceae bacterium]
MRFVELLWPSKPQPAQSKRIALGRLRFAMVAVALGFSLLGGKAFYLATNPELRSSHASKSQPLIERGHITDRNGKVLATSVPVKILHADPKLILDPFETAAKLAPLLPKWTEERLLKRFATNTRYVELERRLTPRRHRDILNLGLPGIAVTPTNARLYPHGNEAAHILGTIDVDGKGIAGIEKQFDETLQKGLPVALSIDVGVQAIMRAEIQKQIDEFEAIGGAGLILDIKTGEILALASLPDFNPNHFASAIDDARFNRATKGVFEMGSIFKVLNTAVALESGAVALGQRFEVSKPLRVSRFQIRDYHPYDRPLNISEILVYSSNIGSARIAEAIGPDTQRAYMERLGLLDRLSLELPEVARPLIPQRWERIASMTISYGHGLSVTPVHASAAIAAAAGDGVYRAPTLLKRDPLSVPLETRIFSADNVKAVRSMMRLVVSHKDGTGNFAEAPGYLVGGKTGTAEKIEGKKYNKKANMVSFVGTFPAHDPAYLLFVMVDEPKGQKQSYGYATAGWVAAPAIRRIVEQIAPKLGIYPVDENAPEIRQNLIPGLQIGKEDSKSAAL